MRCPKCNAEIPAGVSTCPACSPAEEAGRAADPPLDALWESSPGPEDETPVSGPPPTPGGERGGASQASVGTRVVTLDPQANRGTRVVEISLPRQVKQAARQQQPQGARADARSRMATFKQLELEESGVSRGIDESIKAIRLFYARLHRLDRWNVWALVAAFMASFFPWSYIKGQGLVAGIQEYGVASAAAAVLTFLAIYLRTYRRRLSGLLLMLQLVLASGLAAVPVYRVIVSANEQLMVGVYLTAAAAAGVVLLSLARLARFNT